jgi:hypothetical protein
MGKPAIPTLAVVCTKQGAPANNVDTPAAARLSAAAPTVTISTSRPVAAATCDQPYTPPFSATKRSAASLSGEISRNVNSLPTNTAPSFNSPR